MERVQKKEDQSQVADRGMSLIQMAQIMGNQAAIVQMCTKKEMAEYRQYCTDHFIRRHISSKTHTDATKFNSSDMRQIIIYFNRNSNLQQFNFLDHLFGTKINSGVRYIHHLEDEVKKWDVDLKRVNGVRVDERKRFN